MDASSLPIWAQAAGAVAIVLVSTITAVFRYLKTKAPKEPDPATNVVAASFVDSKLLRTLIDRLEDNTEEFSRESKKTQKHLADLKDAINENTEASIVQSDTYSSLVKLLRSFMRLRAQEEL